MGRIRREFSVQAMFSSLPYGFSNDGVNRMGTLLLRVRDPEGSAAGLVETVRRRVAGSATMLAANTPVMRLRLERFGRPSAALAGCQDSGDGPCSASECG